MKPIIVSVVLEPDAAVAMWANSAPAGAPITLQAAAQRLVEAAAKGALSSFRDRPAELERARERFAEVHAGMPEGDKAPDALIVVNLPALPVSNTDTSVPTLATVADDEL